MQNKFTKVPQVVFHGTGMRVNGIEVDGSVMVAWLEHSADRGYVYKASAALNAAYDRTDPAEDSLVGLFDACLNLQEIARAASL